MKTTTPSRKEQKARSSSTSNTPPANDTPIAFYVMMGVMAVAFLLFLGVLLFAL